MNKKAGAKKKSIKPLLLILTLGLVLLVILGVSGISILPRISRSLVLKNLSRTTGLSVVLGEFNSNVTRSQFTLKELAFQNPSGFPKGELARIGEVRVHYSLLPLLWRHFDVTRVEIGFKDFRLLRNQSGALNLPQLTPPSKVEDSIDDLVLNLGSVTYTDLSGPQPVQNTFDLGLQNATYRNVKGVAGIVEIVNWEIQKRIGVEQKPLPSVPEIKLLEVSAASAAKQKPVPAPQRAS